MIRTGRECLETGAGGKVVMYQMPMRRMHLGSFAVGLLMAGAVFLVLPLTELLAQRDQPEPPMVTLNPVAPPPPPPNPPKLEKEPVEPETSSKPSVQPEMKQQTPPLKLRQLEIALNPGTGDALQGDFSVDFAMSGPAVAEFKVFELNEVDQPPSATYQAAPVYPRSMERSGVSGQVVVMFIVDEEGRPRDVSIREASHSAFEQPAREAVLRSRFKPSIKDGKVVAVRVMMPYRFKAP